ncbi:AraC family transcriptional regulator [Aliarcobacter butzleri]|uniref:helix-turn-helix domain-containing protein n=1 Tax=Aliarcobacter butzleri TaxID=28197 RepID=UPI00263E4255|nr:AraC family transcriptional regulator [Aliarcobacter butzleri]MDN5101523.1 AraC family transcriptional regulator [Aliarcobacter butzleri]
MSHNFIMKNMNEFIKSSLFENDFLVNFPKDIGCIMAQKQIITPDILLVKTKTTAKEEIVFQSSSHIQGLLMNIVLDGKTQYTDNSLKKSETLKKNNICIKYINDYDTSTILNKNSSSTSIGIIIKDDFLEKNFSKLLETYTKELKNISSVTIKNQISKNIYLANDLYNSPFEGELQNIYLQSKVLELIYNEFSEVIENFANDEKKVKLTKTDIEALHLAKQIILSREEFLDLTTLSKKVTLNEFKLKYGFKQLFNTSPGQMILEQKMLCAKKLLETSEFSIAEISKFVGYKHQQSFTNAFVKFFKILPKDIMVQRKYYY